MDPLQVRELLLQSGPLRVRLKEAVEQSNSPHCCIFHLHLQYIVLALIEKEGNLLSELALE